MDYPRAGWVVGVGQEGWPDHEEVMNADARDPRRQKGHLRNLRRQKEDLCYPD
jgi:hypothetical protein